MVGRPKKNTEIEEVKQKVYFNKNVMDKLLSCGQLDASFHGQLNKWFSKAKKEESKGGDFMYVEEIYVKKNTTFGRFQGKIKISTKEDYNFTTASMWANSRNLLFRDNYWDLDFVNCHFMIALHLFQKHNLPHEKIEYYINNREKCLEEVIQKAGGDLMCSRYSAKAFFLRICYGGKIKNWCKDVLADSDEFKTGFYKELEEEIHTNIRYLIDNTEEYYRNVKSYTQGVKDAENDTRGIYPATFSNICQDIERKCLMCMKNTFEFFNYIVGGLIYDGCHIWKPSKDGKRLEIPESIIRGIEEKIKEEIGCVMKITVKSMYDEKDDELLCVSDEKMDMLKRLDENSYDNVKKRFEQTVFKCLETGEFYEEQYDYTNIVEGVPPLKSYIRRDKNSLKTSYEHYIYEEEQEKKVGKTTITEIVELPFLDKWFKDKNMRTYSNVVFYPPPLKCNPNIFNTWTGFKAEQYLFEWEKEINKINVKIDELKYSLKKHKQDQGSFPKNWFVDYYKLVKEKLKIKREQKVIEEQPYIHNLNILLNHLKFISGGYNFVGSTKEENEDNFKLNLIENEEKECYEYVIKWISHIIQKPSLKPCVMIIFRSMMHGLGKTSVYNLLQELLGSHLCSKVDNIERDMFGTFNPLLENKLLVFTDELNKKIWTKHRDNFYNLITEDTTNINNKCLKTKTSQSFRRVMGGSNQYEAIVIEKECRRSFVIDIKTNYKPSASYFDNFYSIIKCPKTLKLFFNYLKQYNISKFNAERDRPITKYQEELKEVQTDPLVLYLKNLCFDNAEKYGMNEETEPRNICINHKKLLKDIQLGFIEYMTENVNKDYKISDILLAKKINSFDFLGLYSYTPRNKRTYYFNHKLFLQSLVDKKYIKQIEFETLIKELDPSSKEKEVKEMYENSVDIDEDC